MLMSLTFGFRANQLHVAAHAEGCLSHIDRSENGNGIRTICPAEGTTKPHLLRPRPIGRQRRLGGSAASSGTAAGSSSTVTKARRGESTLTAPSNRTQPVASMTASTVWIMGTSSAIIPRFRILVRPESCLSLSLRPPSFQTPSAAFPPRFFPASSPCPRIRESSLRNEGRGRAGVRPGGPPPPGPPAARRCRIVWSCFFCSSVSNVSSLASISF